MIQECDIFIACIDQETIDCGVVCELCIVLALNKKLLGYYADFRQFLQRRRENVKKSLRYRVYQES